MKLLTLKSRIPALHKPRGGWSDERRGTSTQRGYGAEWQRLRTKVMQRDNGLCQPCLRRGEVSIGSAVDHKAPKSQGGTDSLLNLQCICTPCHKAKTAAESRGLVWGEAMPDR